MYTPEELFNEENDIGESNEWYNVGDKVYIHPDLQECEKGHAVVHDMLKYAGEPATITHKRSTSYNIDTDHGAYAWDDYMLMSEDDFLPQTQTLDIGVLLN